jgi:hypothetical protein
LVKQVLKTRIEDSVLAKQMDAIQLKKLKNIQSQKCKEFQRMDGAKMLELKEECN